MTTNQPKRVSKELWWYLSESERTFLIHELLHDILENLNVKDK